MNAKLYPTSANAVASLGDIWLAKKDTTKALAYYEKALRCDPGSRRRKTWFRKLKHGPEPPHAA
jgi:predicted negative regulator of RcsB-dependent stress response